MLVKSAKILRLKSAKFLKLKSADFSNFCKILWFEINLRKHIFAKIEVLQKKEGLSNLQNVVALPSRRQKSQNGPQVGYTKPYS